MQEHCSPWGSTDNESNNQENCQGFEDSFTSESYNNPNTQHSSEYIPLDDSTQYLESLERKLSRLQGRTSGQRTKESRQLIDALVGSRSSHTHQLLQSQDNTASGYSESDESLAASSSTAAAIDPHSALGVMMRRVVPDKVALSHEELCQLLEADILAKVTEALQEEEDQSIPQQNTIQNTPHQFSETQNTNLEKAHSSSIKKQNVDIQTSAEERKEHSSDEGEK